MSKKSLTNGLARLQPSALRGVVASRPAASSQRGVSLVEVMIVVAIMAMLAGGVAVFALPQFRKAQVDTAVTGARTMRRAVQTWQMMNSETTCPTVSMLIEQKQLDRGSSTDDPWGQQYELDCSDDEVFVLSFGPDRKKGTQDDIRVPEELARNQG